MYLSQHVKVFILHLSYTELFRYTKYKGHSFLRNCYSYASGKIDFKYLSSCTAQSV